MTLNSVESANLDPVLRTAFSFLSIREELEGIEELEDDHQMGICTTIEG